MASQKAEDKKVKTYYILYCKLFTNKMGIPFFYSNTFSLIVSFLRDKNI